MEGLGIIDVVSRIVHVGTAIALVGGSVFTLLVLLPAARVLGEREHRDLAEAVQRRWRWFVHLGILLFLASGLYNYVRAIPQHQDDGLYHALLGTKMLLALAVFFLAAALVGRSRRLEPLRQARRRWLTVLVLLATVIVAISGFVKIRGPRDEAPQAEAPRAEAPLEAAPGVREGGSGER